MFAGSHRHSDVGSCLQRLCDGYGLELQLREVDTLIHGDADDLTSDGVWERLLADIQKGAFDIIIGSPPCHTHSRACWRGGEGPCPLRSREHPRGFPWLSGSRLQKANLANLLIDRTLQAARAGHDSPACSRFLLEHPEDLGAVASGGCPASIWQSEEIAELASHTGAITGALHQCHFEGGRSSKPTRLMGTVSNLASAVHPGWPTFSTSGQYLGPLPWRCGHDAGHPPLIGWDPESNAWRTSFSAAYPMGLCMCLAELCVLDFLYRPSPTVGKVGGLGFGESSVTKAPVLPSSDLVDISPECSKALCSALSSIEWPPSARSYVSGRALCVGALSSSNGGASIWSGNETLSSVIRETNRAFSAALDKAGWSFSWSSLQINHNTIAQWHRDEKNLGDSVIFSVGNYSGGQFVLDKVGSFDIRDKMLWFNGLTKHRSTDFEGDRWSVVAFTSPATRCCDLRQRDELRALGFRLPPPSAPPFRSSPLTRKKTALQEGELYVGRSRRWGDGFWGNNYRVHGSEDRQAVVDAYEKDLRLDVTRRRHLGSLSGKGLVCHCASDQPCHIDSIVKVYKEFFEVPPEEKVVDPYEKLREELAEKDTSDEDEQGRIRPKKGSGVLGGGAPIHYFTGGKKKWFEDGAGLCSPGRWHPEKRGLVSGDLGRLLKSELLPLLFKHVDVKRLACHLACNKVKECPFSEELVLACLKVIGDFLARQGMKGVDLVVPAGQKIRLHVLAGLAKVMGDPDWEVLVQGVDSYLAGLPIGVERPLPRTPAVYERKRKWRKYDVADCPPCSKANYVSCSGNTEAIEAQFQEEKEMGFMRVEQEAAIKEEYGDDICVAALGAIEKGDNSFRIIHDGTHGVQVNPRIIQRDQVRLPGGSELKLITHFASKRGKSVFGLSGDISKAHRLPVIRRKDHGLQLCRLDDSRYWVNQVGTFGIGSAAYWWSRLAAVASRLVLYLHGHDWVWQLLYADDYLWYVSGGDPFGHLILSILVYHILGFPFAWHKFKGGFELSWIGYWADLTTWQVGLSDARAEWIMRWLEDLMSGNQVSCHRATEGLGRLTFAVAVADTYRPFLGPWYAWSAACRGRVMTETPLGLKVIAKFLRDKVKSDLLRADARLFHEGDPPAREFPDFRADARAEGEEVVIGGWLSQGGRSTQDAPWFSIRVTRKAFPWIWSRGEPGRNIAALELLATLFCIVLFAGSFKGTQIAITGLTDNRGNSLALLKFMTTKFPLSAVLMELAAWVQEVSGGQGLSLLWVPRLQNEEADALSNEHFDGFDMAKRIVVDPAEVQWKVLPSMVVYGTDLLARSEELKARKATMPEETDRGNKRRKAGHRLRDSDPW